MFAHIRQGCRNEAQQVNKSPPFPCLPVCVCVATRSDENSFFFFFFFFLKPEPMQKTDFRIYLFIFFFTNEDQTTLYKLYFFSLRLFFSLNPTFCYALISSFFKKRIHSYIHRETYICTHTERD